MEILLVGHKGYIGAFLYNELHTLGLSITGYDLKDGMESRGENIPNIPKYDIVIYLAG